MCICSLIALNNLSNAVILWSKMVGCKELVATYRRCLLKTSSLIN